MGMYNVQAPLFKLEMGMFVISTQSGNNDRKLEFSIIAILAEENNISSSFELL